MWKTLSRALGATLLCAAAAAAQAQQPVTTLKLGWATSDSATDPLAIGAHAFKKHVEQMSNNAIQVQLYPNRQIGDEKQLVEGLRFGTVDAAVVTNAVTAQADGAFQVLDLPFVFENDKQVQKVLDGAVGEELGKRAMDKLSKEQQALLHKAAKEAVQEQRQAMADATPKALASLEKSGMKVNSIGDVAAFRKAVAPVYEKTRAAGHGKLLDAILASTGGAK
jgi:TRAP-type C4-dicarboxylate transport system substrate-binding protein